MKLVVFDDYRVGVLDGEQVRDVSAVIPRWASGDRHAMNRLIAGWSELRGAVEKAAAGGAARKLSEVRLRAPLPAPGQLLAAPSNYRAHIAEMRAMPAARPGRSGGSQSADVLGFFMKANGSISGPQEPITLPQRDYPDRRFDHEGEIAFVIGAPAKGVSPADAIKHIFGYTIMIDVTLRATAEKAEERVQRKSFATFSPMGPCITTADEMGDWRNLSVKLWLNGEQKQDARATDMIVDIPNLLSRASHIMPLEPGDVYTTGSPPGVGQLAVGDTVIVEAQGIGRMSLPVIAREW